MAESWPGRKPSSPSRQPKSHGRKPPAPKNVPKQHGRRPSPPPPRSGRNMGKSSSSAHPAAQNLAYVLVIFPAGVFVALVTYLAHGYGLL